MTSSGVWSFLLGSEHDNANFMYINFSHINLLFEVESNETIKYLLFFIMYDMVCWSMTHIQMWGYFIQCHSAFSFMMVSTAAMASGVTTGCAWPSRGEYAAELMPFVNFLVHSYTCCSDRHASPHRTFIRRWISTDFNPSVLKNVMTKSCFLCMLQAGPPSLHYYCASCCVPA